MLTPDPANRPVAKVIAAKLEVVIANAPDVTIKPDIVVKVEQGGTADAHDRTDLDLGAVKTNAAPKTGSDAPTVQLSRPKSAAAKPQAPAQSGIVKQIGVGVGSSAVGMAAGVATDWTLSKAGVRNPAVKFAVSLATGTAASLFVTKVITGAAPPVVKSAKGIGTGIAGGFLASSMYNSALDSAGAGEQSLARSAPAQVAVGVGGGALFSAAGAAALPFGIFAVANELPAMITPETAAAKANAVEKAREQMAYEFTHKSGVAKWTAGVALGLSLIPIFNKGVVGLLVDAKDGK